MLKLLNGLVPVNIQLFILAGTNWIVPCIFTRCCGSILKSKVSDPVVLFTSIMFPVVVNEPVYIKG